MNCKKKKQIFSKCKNKHNNKKKILEDTLLSEDELIEDVSKMLKNPLLESPDSGSSINKYFKNVSECKSDDFK